MGAVSEDLGPVASALVGSGRVGDEPRPAEAFLGL